MEKVTLTEQDIDGFNPNQLSIVRSSLGVGEGELVPGTYNADDNFFRNLVENNLIKKPTEKPKLNLGASSVDPTYDFTGMGTLGRYMKPAMDIMNQIYRETGEPTQREKDINMGRAALKFFTTMGAQSSVPGATALGAANQAGALVAQDYLNAEAKKDAENRSMKQKRLIGGIGLAQSIANVEKSLIPKVKTYKGATRGDLVKYMSKEEAEKYFENYGMSRDNPNFADAVAKITAPKPELIGKYITDGTGKQLELLPVYKGDEIVRFNLSAQPGAQVGLNYAGKLERVKEINKKILPNLQKARLNLIPSAQTAMDILFRGETTGRFENTMQPFKEFFAGFFGLSQRNLEGKQLLETISNRLAPGMREAGSGPMSDKDLEVFKSAILSLNNTPYANYISLYTFKKAKENMIRMVTLEQQMLAENFSQTEINNKMAEVDTGIFKRFVNEGADGKRLYDDEVEDANGLTEEDRALEEFMGSLKDGDVVLNRDSFGKDLYSDKRTLMVVGGPDTFK